MAARGVARDSRSAGAPSRGLAGFDDAPGNGVNLLRFADSRDGWAFGPGLQSTHDGGGHWRAVRLPGARPSVEDLATACGVTDAVVAQRGGAGRLYNTAVEADRWRPVLSLPAGQRSSDQIVLHGRAGWVLSAGIALPRREGARASRCTPGRSDRAMSGRESLDRAATERTARHANAGRRRGYETAGRDRWEALRRRHPDRRRRAVRLWRRGTLLAAARRQPQATGDSALAVLSRSPRALARRSSRPRRARRRGSGTGCPRHRGTEIPVPRPRRGGGAARYSPRGCGPGAR